MKKFGFIYNPLSGKNGSKKEINDIRQYTDSIVDSDIYEVDENQSITDLANNLEPNYECIVACGGDGTVRKIAAVLVGTNTRLGVIPTGSGNDFAKSLGVPINLKKSFNILSSYQSKEIDVGRCNDIVFINTIGFGFDGLTNQHAAKIKQFNGPLRYLVASLKANYNRRNFRVEIQTDTSRYKTELMMATCANGKVEGGVFWIAPNASLSDGQLQFVTMEPISRWLLPLYLPFLLLGRTDLLSKLSTEGVNNVQLSFDSNVPIHVDGEIFSTEKKVFDIGICPKSLQVIC